MTHQVGGGKWEMKEDFFPTPNKHFRAVEAYFTEANVGYAVTVLLSYYLLFKQSNFF